MAIYLIEHGANIFAKGKNDATALSLAKFGKGVDVDEISMLLKKHGAK